MKMIVAVVLALVAVSVAVPVENPANYPKIVRSEFEPRPEGGYIFNFETENGITRQEQGEIREAVDEDNKPHPVVVVRGSYSYTDPEGNPENINYFADETGFHAEGPSIPTVAPARR